MNQLVRPKQVFIRDITVREGFQREERRIPTSAKLWIVAQLILAGFRRLEVTNFANPKRLPQFADAEELLRLIRTQRSLERYLPSVELSAITINKAAVDRSIAACRAGFGPDRILLVISVSETYQQNNSGMTIDDYWRMSEECIRHAKDSGLKVCGVIKHHPFRSNHGGTRWSAGQFCRRRSGSRHGGILP
jgi:hydroxymethylglutaryl-CoA lyase